jgi:hypothetical protein
VLVPTFYLDKIQDIAQVSEGKARKLMEACVCCLIASKHKNGVNLEVKDDVAVTKHPVSWPSRIDIEAINRSYNQDDAVEEGAEAVALLVSIAKTEFNAVERASTTTGIDYWLGHKNGSSNNPFKRAGRLEISGILKENIKNTVKGRIQAKLAQTLPSDRTFNVYVVIVEFSKPYATMVLKK